MSEANIDELLTKTNPLGPVRHEKILRRANFSSSNVLIYRNDLFDSVTSRENPIIIGRRGSGKTAVVKALISKAMGKNYSYGEGLIDSANGNIIAFINSWDHLDDLVNKVGSDIIIAYGPEVDWQAVLPETVAKIWAQHIWNFIFQEIYRNSLNDDVELDNVPRYISDVNKYITGEDFLSSNIRMSRFALNEAVSKTRDSVLKHLRESGKRCVIVIDSLEEYPVHAPRFERVTAGFIRCLNEFVEAFPECKIYCCLPEEIEHIVSANYPNVIKDGGRDSVSYLRWKPFDIFRIVAKRYRKFLTLYVEDVDFVQFMDSLDLDKRSDLHSFFGRVMPENIINREGKEERTLAYITRHTHLLPREFIQIFNAAIIASNKKSAGSWLLTGEEIVQAIHEQEVDFARQVFVPYKHIYPVLLKSVRETIAALPPIFSGRDIKDALKLEKLASNETLGVWSTLFAMGVIGYIDDSYKYKNSDRYEFARFYFNATRDFLLADDRRYCVHPMFSGAWNCQRLGNDGKFIYPADVDSEIVT